MRIQHNIMAMNAYRNYTNNTSALAKNLEKLSSGYRINRAGDDAAGLAISEKMRAQITGLDAAQKNVKDGISLVQTAEGALQEVQDMLNRMVYLATQSANGTYDNEVDRANLQKEVDQLSEEIDRIADSANFNGIKLLDGKLGLNTEAFSLTATDAVAQSDGKIDVSSMVAGNFHPEAAGVTTATNPAASIDLGDLKIEGAATGTAAKIKLTVAGQEFEVTAGSTATTYDATAIASGLATALKAATGTTGIYGVDKTTGAVHTAGASSNDAIRIGDAVYSVATNAGKVNLTYEGFFTGTTYTEKADGDFSVEQAKAFNEDLGFEVAVGTVTNGENTGNVRHAAVSVEYAKAKEPASLAGISLKLTSDLVKDGGTLEIDGKKFTFRVDPNSTIDATGAGVIDVSSAKTEEEAIHMAVDKLSKATAFTGTDGRSFQLSSAGPDTIHIDQTVKSNAGKELETQADLLKLIEATGVATEAASAGTDIKALDASKIAEGNTITVGDVQYVFTADTTNKTETDTVKYVDMADAMNNLKEKINADTGTHSAVATINSAGDTVTVRASTATGTAPTVLGKGLTLQIGDTSDSYNQLSVLVKDMHAAALGIGDISVASQDSAALAVNKIKDAINNVSSVRGTLGATQNRLEHTANNLSVMEENITDAESSIRDTDIAEEMMAYTKNNILIQSAQAMLAQANMVPQGVLQLLG